MHLERNTKKNISQMVGTGFKRIKFQNNNLNINHSQRTNTEFFVILNVIFRNVMHSV